MVLVLDHLVKDEGPGSVLIHPQTEAMTAEPDALSHCQRSDTSASDPSMSSVLSRSSLECVAMEKSLGSAYRTRLDSTASDKSQSPLQCGPVDSGASEQGVDSCIRQRLGSVVLDCKFAPEFGSDSDNLISLSRERTDSGASNHSGSTTSEEKGPAQEVEVALSGSTCSSDSEAESRTIQTRPNEDQVIDQEQPHGTVLSLRHHPNGLLNGSAKGKIDFHKQKVVYTRFLSD